ncbi:putative bifunctional amine oxidase [Fusarium oxysporum f. sp. raphani]|uniref:Putative bifunctional amine oxidase n=1 Tax=Fusarium oxysporum f. sp. raphani TaxID=96318 RepID=A0A8J5PNH4_FUSOX|nr:putative bifunctional amine oxidase [Fusarium oxysporum f. sp. raphani]
MTDALSADFDAGFNLLMEYDSLSVRQFLLKKGFTNNEIDWMETVNDATGHYGTHSMSQAVMEEWIFYSADANNWTLINGGMDMLTKGMTHIIKNKPVLNHRVTNINKNFDKGLKIVINDTEEYDYAHVISTVPMGALQIINMTELDLGYYQKTAFRTLNYDPATKIGFKFKTRWWENLSTGSFKGGQSFTDLPIRRFVNGVSYEFLLSEFEDYHAYDWYDSAYSNGGFAMFSPGQFSSVMPWLMRPAAEGHMHFAGEALSSGHAWIIGAVNSAWRTVYEILCTEGLEEKKKQFIEQWDIIDEVDMCWYDWSPEGNP